MKNEEKGNLTRKVTVRFTETEYKKIDTGFKRKHRTATEWLYPQRIAC